MSEKITANAEKAFFNYIYENPLWFNKIPHSYFKDPNIRFIYDKIKNEYVSLKKKIVPSIDQVILLCDLVGNNNSKISKDYIYTLLDTGDEFSEEFVRTRFQAWKISNALEQCVDFSADSCRTLEYTNLEKVSEIAQKVKTAFKELSLIDESDADLGEDFDDPESHSQDQNKYKIPTGWDTVDKLLDGGWDYSTLTVLLGATNAGKSMWLDNIAANVADNGKNVAFVTLEMASHKVMRRLGCMRLKIPSKQYTELSKDKIYMKNQINALRNRKGNGLFESKIGKIFVKKYDTSTCTVTDIDSYITKLEESKNIKIDVLIVDYLGIMGIEKGLNINATMLYQKGKHLSEGLRYLADKHRVAVITATQTSKDVWDANDISLNDIPESKAIAESADTSFGIIRNPEMKKHNKYRLKLLKLRDGENYGENIEFDFNNDFLTISNDKFVEINKK